MSAYVNKDVHQSKHILAANVSIRQHTSAYVSIRQHTTTRTSTSRSTFWLLAGSASEGGSRVGDGEGEVGAGIGGLGGGGGARDGDVLGFGGVAASEGGMLVEGLAASACIR
jgi:hypothetical protein